MILATVVGARPQFIKAAVISRAIHHHNQSGEDKIREIIIHTGQHYDYGMSDIFFTEMRIPQPAYNLGVSNLSHGAMTGHMIEGIERVLIEKKPDAVLVYGDTDSTLAGSLAAVKLHIPIAHVEAGLRSFNKIMPEEINRILSDRISDFLFCPTDTAVKNLYDEGLDRAVTMMGGPPVIAKVGDVMYDAMLFYRRIARPSHEIQELTDRLHEGFYLATVHREENTDSPDRLRDILGALSHISRRVPVVLPLHPRTRKLLAKYGLRGEGLISLDPVGYFDMLTLLAHCRAVFTDSGGLQKEAYFSRKPCVTLRDETEWVELLECGVNVLTGADRDLIIAAEERLGDKRDYGAPLYGGGDAGAKIVSILAHSITKTGVFPSGLRRDHDPKSGRIEKIPGKKVVH